VAGKPIPKVVPHRPAAPRRVPGFLARARRILLTPKTEWAAINAEFTNAGAIYRGYIIPLAAIGPIAFVAGVGVFGEQGTLFGVLETPFRTALQDGIAHYVLGLLSPMLVAVVLELVAPSFSGQGNRVQALKVAAYASTPAWLFAVLGLVPRLAPFALIGVVWSLYLAYSGAPLLLKVPAEGSKTAAFGAVAAAVLAVAALLVEVLARAFV
jgi:hypothetical protein